jgi:hypothetical protein
MVVVGGHSSRSEVVKASVKRLTTRANTGAAKIVAHFRRDGTTADRALRPITVLWAWVRSVMGAHIRGVTKSEPFSRCNDFQAAT